MTGPDAKSCTSMVMSLSTKTSSSMFRSGTTKWSPRAGTHTSPAARSSRASSIETSAAWAASCVDRRLRGCRRKGCDAGGAGDVRVGISGGPTRRGAASSTRRGCRSAASWSTRRTGSPPSRSTARSTRCRSRSRWQAWRGRDARRLPVRGQGRPLHHPHEEAQRRRRPGGQLPGVGDARARRQARADALAAAAQPGLRRRPDRRLPRPAAAHDGGRRGDGGRARRADGRAGVRDHRRGPAAAARDGGAPPDLRDRRLPGPAALA